MSQGPEQSAGLLQCQCGSTDLCIASRAPVSVYVSASRIVRVAVADDEEQVPGGVARCLACDRFWVLDRRPEVGAMPAWEPGRSPDALRGSGR